MRRLNTIGYIKEQLACAEADLYQGAGTMPLHCFEDLVRRINMLRYKLYTFKGGLYERQELL